MTSERTRRPSKNENWCNGDKTAGNEQTRLMSQPESRVVSEPIISTILVSNRLKTTIWALPYSGAPRRLSPPAGGRTTLPGVSGPGRAGPSRARRTAAKRVGRGLASPWCDPAEKTGHQKEQRLGSVKPEQTLVSVSEPTSHQTQG